MQYRTKTLFITLLLGLVALISCKKDDGPGTPSTPGGPAQYGTPFQKVPEIQDINLYEVNPRVFSAAKNLNGITSRLDSIKKMGINVVWLMPIYPTGTERSVGSPYAIKNYTAVHPDYGTLTDLRALVDKAHALDMAVILDWVANHTAWDHPWTLSHKDWYAQDGSGAIIHPPGTNWQDVAELNYSNTALRQEMIKAMTHWVLEANVDGFRCDYANGVPTDFWKQAIDSLRSIPNRKFIFFAETEDKTLMTAGFNMLFGWPFYTKLKDVFGGVAAQQLQGTHQSEYNGLASDRHIVRWITNHDQYAWDGTPQSIFKSKAGAMTAFVIASTMGGVPLVYGGQEVDVPQQIPFFEGNNYTIDWTANPGTKRQYEQVLQFRSQSKALRQGTLTDYSGTNVAAFKRKSGTEEVVVLANVRNTATTFTIPSALANSTWTNALSGASVTLGSSVNLGAYEYLLLKK